MEPAEQAGLVESIHEIIVSHEGGPLHVRANMGRSKIVDCEGILLQAHPSLFIVEVHGKRGHITKQSYQYVDVLTGMVELTDPQTGEKLFERPFES